jgi:hypothetical protein
MFNKTYHYEIHDLLTQFIAAMDDVVISRYNKNREEKEQIKVRYVHAPKERVLYDIINKAQNITVPVISVSVSDIQRDENRVFNKIEGFYSPVKREVHGQFTAQIPMPVPINLTVNLNILTNYQSDMDQIISNFVPYSNPYIVISWRLPDGFGLELINEIRSEVLWNGNISVEYPIDLEASGKPRFSASTSFVIKGWLFPAAPFEPLKNIYFIDSNFHVSSKLKLDYESFLTSLTADNYVYDPTTGLTNENEVVSVSAAPLLTNLYVTTSSKYIELSGHDILYQNKLEDKIEFLILGQNLQYTKHVMLSSNSPTLYKNLSTFDFTYYPSITAFDIENKYLQILGKNAITVTLPPITGNGDINFIVVNKVGWADTNSIDSKVTYLSATYGSYFYASVDDSWYNVKNWYTDSDHIYRAERLPLSGSEITVLGVVPPFVNIDDPRWAQPAIFNTSTNSVTFSSNTNKRVTSTINGYATFLGNAIHDSTETSGKYFYATMDNSWYNTNNWFTDYGHTIEADTLPPSGSNVTILGTTPPFVNLDDVSWMQPDIINSGTVGIEFYSDQNKKVTSIINGDATFLGNAIHDSTSTSGKYFYATTNNSWYNINNWFTNYSHTIQAATLPYSESNVTILGTTPPFVNLDNVNWIQPEVINSGTVGIEFYSDQNKKVTCLINGDATFLGNSKHDI